MIENKKLILAIGALVLLGFGVEFLKGVDELDVRQAQRLEGSDLSKIGDRNFMRSDLNQDSFAVNTDKRNGFKLSNIDPNMGEYDANKDKKKAKGKLKKKKKKKKKKAKKKSKKDLGPEFIVEVYEESDEGTPVQEEAYQPEGAIAVDPNSAAPKVEDSEYEKWANLLLVRPDRQETQAFIREYQSGKLKTDTFYRIVEEMYAKDITEFRSLAVLSAGATPSLKSYSFLITAYSSDENSGIRSEATAELKDYQSLQYLWVPRSIISALQVQNPASIEVAASTIDTASASYLTPRARAGEESAPTVRAEYKRYFMSMLPSLELAIQRYKDSPEVVSSLTNALTRIQQLEVVAFNEEF